MSTPRATRHHGRVSHDDGRYQAVCAGCGRAGPWRTSYVVAAQDLEQHVDGQQRLDLEAGER